MTEFDLTSDVSIIDYAKKLKGQTLREACRKEVIDQLGKGKGKFGVKLEEFYFGITPNSNPEPDFKEAGLELKSSPLKVLKNGTFRAKERIVLNIINYLEVHKETFEYSTFWKKNSYLLLVFYLHSKEDNFLDFAIKLVESWKYPTEDLKVIRHDWELISKKIKEGKAHELSEGDTFYLGACTKGATAKKSLRKQPFNEKRAKQRAYSLKQGYVNHIIASISGTESSSYGKILASSEILKEGLSIEEFVVSKFKPFYGQSIEEIQKTLQVELNAGSKSFTASVTNAILGIAARKKIEEFEKAEIRVKAVRLKKNDVPKEHISFPSFKYTDIIKKNWEESSFKDILESKFFFVFFRIEEKKLILEKVKFWNMPHSDIMTAKKVWDKTIQLLNEGSIVKEVKSTKAGIRRFTHFPKPDDNKVSHVRPHAKNSADCYELPKIDKLTKVSEYTKHCFWLNQKYIRDEIYLKN